MRGRRRSTRARARATATLALAALLALLLPSAACRGAAPGGQNRARAVDLIFHFKDAHRRPLDAAFAIREHTFGGRSRASLTVPAASRVMWPLFVPHRARLHVFVGVPGANRPAAVAVRVGISDERRYETLHEQIVTSAECAADWVPVETDLSAYAGRKFSLFFRPDERKWNIIIATQPVEGSAAFVALGEPGIDADLESVREYRQRLIAAAQSGG